MDSRSGSGSAPPIAVETGALDILPQPAPVQRSLSSSSSGRGSMRLYRLASQAALETIAASGNLRPQSIRAIDLSSRRIGETTEWECIFCAQSCAVDDRIVLCDVGHEVCGSCAVQTLRVSLTQDATSVPCPKCKVDSGAGSPDTGSDITSAIPWINSAAVAATQAWSAMAAATGLLPEGVRPLGTEEVNRYSRVMVCEAMKACDKGERLVRCPNSACGAMHVAPTPPESGCSSSTAPQPQPVPCGYCKTIFCVLCGADWDEARHKGE